MIQGQAFDHFLERPQHDVELVVGSHEDFRAVATTRDRSLHLFASDGGLDFFADINDDYGSENWPLIRAMRSRTNPLDQCSIKLQSLKVISGSHLGGRLDRVLRASLSHVLITNHAIYGASTAVWIAGDEQDAAAPLRIRQMAAEFDDAVSVWPQREFVRRSS